MALGQAGNRMPFALAMQSLAESHGTVVRTNADVQRLTREDGAWALDITHADKRDRLVADSVIFATGGFQNSVEHLATYVTKSPSSLVVRSNKVSAGAPIDLALPHGARLSNGMSSFYGHTLPWLPGRDITEDLYIPASQYYSDYCVIINQLGLRFTDESMGVLDEHNAQEGARQPHARYFLVFDERVRQEHVAGDLGLPGIVASKIPDRVELVRELGGNVVEAPTLEQLASSLSAFDVPPQNALDTFTAYNDAVSGRDPDTLFPSRVANRTPLAEPPYVAIECVAGITYTMGGLAIGESGRVLRTNDGELDGVYAVGADAGGVFHDAYGGGLAWAGVTGRRAGIAAATA